MRIIKVSNIINNATFSGDDDAERKKQDAGNRCTPDTPDTPAVSPEPPPVSRDDFCKTNACERDLYDAILAYVKARDPVTFVELTRNLSPYYWVDGNHAVVTAGASHVVLWDGVNQRLVNVVSRLFAERKLHLAGANEAVYAMQGATLNLPVADGSSVRLRTRQWCPVFLRYGDEALAQPLSRDEIMTSAMRV